MAVYKSTYCSPLLESIDIRVVATLEDQKPCIWFKNKINSSNKLITGYSIRLLDMNNNVVFPKGTAKISPLSELQTLVTNSDINSGLNGTMMQIPFFQAWNMNDGEFIFNRLLNSYNALYYIPPYKADHFLSVVTSLNTWEYDSDENFWFNDGWDGTLNGESTYKSEIVFVLSDDNTVGPTGLFIIGEEGHLIPYTDVDGVALNYIDQDGYNRLCGVSAADNFRVVILHGDTHNKILCYNSTWTVLSGEFVNLWRDFDGNLYNLDLENGSYKWELTLYQGQGIESGVTAKEYSYTGLSYDWYDMMLTTGNILGSTNKRLQIASAKGEIPQGSSNSPLVLQGRFVQLVQEQSQIGMRSEVRSYDASFGHVYPREDAFTLDMIERATAVRFYKHTNDIEYTLAKERVAAATTDGENIQIYTTTYETFSGTQEQKEAAIAEGILYYEINNEYFLATAYDAGMTYYTREITINSTLGCIVVDGYQTKENDFILVKNQTNSWENGIYQVSATSWNRAGEFSTWGNFIGAIFLVEKGVVNSGSNWESMAGPYGVLYDINSATSGNSPLYFKVERPILLFSDQLDLTTTLCMANEFGSYQDYDVEHTIVVSDPSADGIPFSAGQTILCWEDVVLLYIIAVDNNSITYKRLHLPHTPSVSDPLYVYVEEGEVFGKEVVKTTSLTPTEATLSLDLHTALLLKNTTNKTYISPFVGAQKGMAIKLLNNKFVTLQSDYSQVRWLTINDINTKLWYIEHDTLTEAIKSASLSDNSVPYNYELRSYFKASDENPFTCYEAPYVKLYIDGIPYSGFTGVEPYQVLDPDLYEQVDYLVDEGVFNVVVPTLETIENRFVTFQGFYFQHQQMSWESYRWVLLNSDGKVIQDTGRRYDKDIIVTFYGLENKKNYAAILYINDEANNMLTLTIYFKVDYEPDLSLEGLDFSADFDCSTHSVILNFGSYSLIAPSVDTSASYKYVSANYQISGVEWDESYSLHSGLLHIHDNDNYDITNNATPIPLIDIYAEPDTDDFTALSASVRNGINYTHSFPQGENVVSLSSNVIESNLDNEFYVETEIQLTDNYCGKFLSFTVDNPNSGGNPITVEFGIPDNFDDGYTLSDHNADRGLIYIDISGESTRHYLFNGENDSLENFDLTTVTKKRFIMQNPYNLPANPSADSEYHAYIFESSDGEPLYLWYLKEVTSNAQNPYHDKVSYLNSAYDLGNLGLVASGHISGPTYWAENRGELYYFTTGDTGFADALEQSSSDVPGINLTKVPLGHLRDVDSEQYIPLWPEDDSSGNLIWDEGALEDSVQPVFWDDVTGDLSNAGNGRGSLASYVVRPRHPGMLLSSHSFVVAVKCYDIDKLFNYAGSLQFTGDANEENTTHIMYSTDNILDIVIFPQD